jgi:hypothetical protein
MDIENPQICVILFVEQNKEVLIMICGNDLIHGKPYQM